MSRGLTLSQIHALVLAIPERARRGCSIGIRSAIPWTGESVAKVSGTSYFISQCNSPLAVRESIRQLPPDGTRVIVTDLRDTDLDSDILLRLAKGQLLTVDQWSMVKSLFQASAVDPRIVKQDWLADLLIELATKSPFPQAVGGFLDAEQVWPIVLASTLELPSTSLDLESILKWSTSKSSVAKWKLMSKEFRVSASEWLASSAGPVVRHVLQTLDLNGEADPLPLGLVLDVLCQPDKAHDLAIQRVRLEERYLGGESLPVELARRWATTSKGILQLGFLDDSLEKVVMNRAESILKNIDAGSVAYLSDVLPLGFSQRLERLGATISARLDESIFGVSDELVAQVGQLKQHARVRRETSRVGRVEMAVRLLRWLELETSSPRKFSSFDDASEYQLLEGGFLDWARLNLHFAEPVASLANAYDKLFGLTHRAREKQAERFARLLIDWTKFGSAGTNVVGVEDITREYLAPLARNTNGKSRPVLMVVLDGMSVGVFRQLIKDIGLRQDWLWGVKEQVGHLTGAVATLPSVTECSRASLFAGKIAKGAADFEVRAFGENQALVPVCKSTKPPKLFHKASLNPGLESELSTDVREAIADSSQTVIAVVVNAIDDHLAKGQQIEPTWTQDGIRTLSLLLHEAKNAGRHVLLVSDHGHVIDVRSSYVNQGGGGERWRPDVDEPREFELRATGNRVVVAKALIAPWTDSVRYSPSKKNGYHGGIHPQEMIVPIAYLCPTDELPDGWTEAPNDEPAWWDVSIETSPLACDAMPVLAPSAPKPIPPGMLFNVDELPEELDVQNEDVVETHGRAAGSSILNQKRSPEWIEALFRSSVFQEQKRLGGRSVPSEFVLGELISAIDERGGAITSVALSRAIQVPPMRLRGLLAVAQRVLNVDGYDVLAREDLSDTIRLDRALLVKQFGL